MEPVAISSRPPEVDKVMQGDVMQLRARLLHGDQQVCHCNRAFSVFVCLLCEQGAASRSMSERCHNSPPVIPLRRNEAPMIQLMFEIGPRPDCGLLRNIKGQIPRQVMLLADCGADGVWMCRIPNWAASGLDRQDGRAGRKT